MFELMVTETNRSVTQFLQTNLIKNNSRAHQWKDTTSDEMENFIGIIFIMGLAKFPEIHLYWSTSPIYGSSLAQKYES